MMLDQILPQPSLPALDRAPPARDWDVLAPRPQTLTTTQISRAEGLLSAQTHTVVVGPRGRVWVSGPCGLAAYDGVEVRAYDQSNGLTLQGLRGLAMDSERRIWVGSDAGLDLVECDGSIRQMAFGPSWPFGPAKRIVTTPDGRIYIGTAEGLILGSSVEGVFSFAPVDHPVLQNDVIFDIAIDSSARVIVASAAAGLSIFAGAAWRTMTRTVYAAVGELTRLAASPTGDILVGGVEGLVAVSPDADLKSETCPLIATGTVLAVRAADGVVWVGSSSRLSLLRESKGIWSITGVANVGATINDLTMDSYGNVWCATDSAGVRKVSFMHAYFAQPELTGAGQFFSVRPGRDGTLLVGTEHALFRASPGIEDEFILIENLADARVWDTLEAPDGTLWIATHRYGLLRRDQSGIRDQIGTSDQTGTRDLAAHSAHSARALNAPCRALAMFDDKLWVGTLGGLVSIAGDVVTEHRDVGGESLGYVYTLLVEADALWIGTLGNGLWRYAAADGLARVENKVLKADGNIYALARNEHGEFAVLQDRQLVRLGAEAALGYAKVLATSTRPNIGWTVAFLSANKIAVGSSDGIVEYDFASGDEIRQIRCGGLGVAGWEFTTSRALHVDYRGRLWCALNASLTLVTPEEITFKVSPPSVSLLNIAWENITVAPTASQHYVVPHGKWRATFHFFSAWLVDETDVQIRYKLVGFDEAWSPLMRRSRFSVNSLAPGTYLLELQAYSPLTGFGPICQLATIEVTAAWWRRFGLDTASSLFDSARAVFTSRARNQRLLETNQALAADVEQRTIEVTNANIALREANERLSSLLRVDAVTLIANRRCFDEAVAAEWKRAVRDKLPLSLFMVDIDHFKAYNDRYGHLRGDACLRMVGQCLATTVRDGVDTCARFGGEEFAIVLPHTSARNALMLAERLCAAIDRLKIESLDSPVAPVVTISVGVNTMDPSSKYSIAQLISGADESLYAAKRAGRNQVGPIGGE